MEFPSMGIAYTVNNALRVEGYGSHWPALWVDKSRELPLFDIEVKVVGMMGITLLIEPLE